MRILSTFDKLVKPPAAIPHVVCKLTGISNERVAKSCAFGTCWDQFIAWSRGCIKDSNITILVSHNLFLYDLVLLQSEIERVKDPNSITFGAWCVIARVAYMVDTLVLSRASVGAGEWPHELTRTKTGRPSHTLSSIYRSVFGNCFENAHDASQDTMALAKLSLSLKSPIRQFIIRPRLCTWCKLAPRHVSRITVQTTSTMVKDLWETHKIHQMKKSLEKIPLSHPTFVQCPLCPTVYSSYFRHNCQSQQPT